MRRYLEIRLRKDAPELAEHLRRERRREAPGFAGSKTKSLHYPVRLVSGAIVRVDWSGPDTSIRPRIDKALAILGRQYAVETPLASDDEPLEVLDREAQESRLLDFVECGNTIAAVTLAKRLYGYDTTEASRFIDEMRAR